MNFNERVTWQHENGHNKNCSIVVFWLPKALQWNHNALLGQHMYEIIQEVLLPELEKEQINMRLLESMPTSLHNGVQHVLLFFISHCSFE